MDRKQSNGKGSTLYLDFYQGQYIHRFLQGQTAFQCAEIISTSPGHEAKFLMMRYPLSFLWESVHSNKNR